MDQPLFEISRFGDKWAVTHGEVVLLLTRTRPEARKLAREAEKVLATAASPGDPGDGRFDEPRSFAPPER